MLYRIIVGGMPLNADYVTVGNPNSYDTYFDPIAALMEAWSVHHKNTGMPTLLTMDNDCPARFDPTWGIMYQRMLHFLVKN